MALSPLSYGSPRYPSPSTQEDEILFLRNTVARLTSQVEAQGQLLDSMADELRVQGNLVPDGVEAPTLHARLRAAEEDLQATGALLATERASRQALEDRLAIMQPVHERVERDAFISEQLSDMVERLQREKNDAEQHALHAKASTLAERALLSGEFSKLSLTLLSIMTHVQELSRAALFLPSTRRGDPSSTPASTPSNNRIVMMDSLASDDDDELFDEEHDETLTEEHDATSRRSSLHGSGDDGGEAVHEAILQAADKGEWEAAVADVVKIRDMFAAQETQGADAAFLGDVSKFVSSRTADGSQLATTTLHHESNRLMRQQETNCRVGLQHLVRDSETLRTAGNLLLGEVKASCHTFGIQARALSHVRQERMKEKRAQAPLLNELQRLRSVLSSESHAQGTQTAELQVQISSLQAKVSELEDENSDLKGFMSQLKLTDIAPDTLKAMSVKALDSPRSAISMDQTAEDDSRIVM